MKLNASGPLDTEKETGMRCAYRAEIQACQIYTGYPKRIQHRRAPTAAIDSPQTSNPLKSARVLLPGGAPARKSAPTVESDDRSTRLAPMFIDHAIGSGGRLPTRWARSGTIGRNAGSTTPDVLLYTDTMPVPNATTGAIVAGVETLARPAVKRSNPCVFWSRKISTVTPVTMRITPHGMC